MKAGGADSSSVALSVALSMDAGQLGSSEQQHQGRTLCGYNGLRLLPVRLLLLRRRRPSRLGQGQWLELAAESFKLISESGTCV